MKPDQASSSDLDLRWRLRQLPKERDVPANAWDALEAKLQSAVQVSEHGSRKPRTRWPAFALAVSVVVIAMLAVPLWMKQSKVAPVDLQAQMMSRQVDFMSLEYQAALQELDHADAQGKLANSADHSELKLLDSSAEQIRHAIMQNPNATYLLDMLRRTYMQRLQITQRLIVS
jgi:hypothetical protein